MEGPSSGCLLLRSSEVKILKPVSEGALQEKWTESLRALLEHAAARGNLDLVTSLLGAGDDYGVGWRGSSGRTLLIAAVQGGDENVVQALLRAGATAEVDVQFGDKFQTALHVAAEEGAEAVASKLLVAGADPNLADKHGRGALHLAAEGEHHRMIGDLVRHGALVNSMDDGGNSPLHLATAMGHTLAISLLLESGANVNMRNGSGASPLYVAVSHHNVGQAEQLILAGSEINLLHMSNMARESVLFEAARCGHLEMVVLLLRHGADATAHDIEGLTALHFLCFYFDDSEDPAAGLVRVLLEAGVPVNARTGGGTLSSHPHGAESTALHFAMAGMSIDTILALLEAGADVNCQNDRGETPLHLACIENNIERVEVLLRWGADETVIDENGRTPVGYTRFNASPNLIRRMLARAPTNRAWRRRGWLVLCRHYSNKARLTPCDSGSSEPDGETTGSPAKVGKGVDGEKMAGGGEGGRTAAESLVARVVDLDVEGVFRTVVGFL